MSKIHSATYPGSNPTQVYKVRIMEEETKKTTLISRVLVGANGEEEEIPLFIYSNAPKSLIPALFDRAKKNILAITMKA